MIHSPPPAIVKMNPEKKSSSEEYGLINIIKTDFLNRLIQSIQDVKRLVKHI